MPLARSVRSTLHSHASRLLTAHPRLLAALLALVGVVAVQGSAAAAGELSTGGFDLGDLGDLVDDAGDMLDNPPIEKNEDMTTDPGP